MNLYDMIGLLAPIFFMIAYGMTAVGKWNGTMVRLHAFNFIGAAVMLVSLWHAWNLPMVVMEVCWGSIAVWGLVKCLMRLRRGNA